MCLDVELFSSVRFLLSVLNVFVWGVYILIFIWGLKLKHANPTGPTDALLVRFVVFVVGVQHLLASMLAGDPHYDNLLLATGISARIFSLGVGIIVLRHHREAL